MAKGKRRKLPRGNQRQGHLSNDEMWQMYRSLVDEDTTGRFLLAKMLFKAEEIVDELMNRHDVEEVAMADLDTAITYINETHCAGDEKDQDSETDSD